MDMFNMYEQHFINQAIMPMKRGAGGGLVNRSQRFKTQNHKSQSFQMMISQITDNEFS